MKLLKSTLMLLFLVAVAGCQTTNAQYRDVSVEEADKLIKQENTFLLDVRTPGEYEVGHLEGAKLIPVSELESRIGELESVKDKEIVVYCRTGSRSTAASEILTKHGYRAANMEGGISDWQAAGKPVVK